MGSWVFSPSYTDSGISHAVKASSFFSLILGYKNVVEAIVCEPRKEFFVV